MESDCTLNLYGSLYVNFCSCEKLTVADVDIRVKFYRASNEFSLISLADDTDKLFKAVIEKASMFVRKITVTESVRLSIEKALLESPARYPHIESLCKSFIMQSGQNSFIKESIFGTEPIKRLTMCMVAKDKFRGSKDTNLFLYKKYKIKRIEIKRGNGSPIAGTPIDTKNIVRIYHNTLTALGIKNGGKISLEDFDNKLIVNFDSTSSQESSKNFTLFPEMAGAPITLKLFFTEALPEAVAFFIIGEKFGQVFIETKRNIQKTKLYSMDNISIKRVVGKLRLLKLSLEAFGRQTIFQE